MAKLSEINELKPIEFDPEQIQLGEFLGFRKDDRIRMSMRSVFDWIKETAEKEGLEIELVDETRLIFKKPNYAT